MYEDILPYLKENFSTVNLPASLSSSSANSLPSHTNSVISPNQPTSSTMPITWRTRAEFACSGCKKSHSLCDWDKDGSGLPLPCRRCTDNGLQCHYLPKSRTTSQKSPDGSSTTSDHVAAQRHLPDNVGEFTYVSGGGPASARPPQHPVGLPATDYSRSQFVDTATTGANYSSGNEIIRNDNVQHLVEGAPPLRDTILHGFAVAAEGTFDMEPADGVEVVEGSLSCMCFDTYPYRCNVHEADEFFYMSPLAL